MEWNDQHSIREFYREQARAHGPDYRGVGYNRRESQILRFEAIARIGDLHGRRLLDVGCGFGELLDFLRARDVRPIYTGLDICPDMIEACRRKFSNGEAVSFVEADVLDWEASERFDYVVASGIFGLRSEHVEARIAPTLQRLLTLADRAVAVNFLSTASPRPVPDRHYADPLRMLELGLALTPAAVLDHSYLPNDFMLTLWPRPPWRVDEGTEHRPPRRSRP